MSNELFLYQYQKEGVDQIVNRFGDVLLADAPGCLSGNTIVSCNRAGRGFKITLEELHKKQNNPGWSNSFSTKVKALCGEEFRQHYIDKVLYQGKKETLRLTLESGKTLEATPDHEILTPSGFRRLDTLSIRDVVLTNGNPECKRCGAKEDVATYQYSKFPGYCKTCIYRFLRKPGNLKSGKHIDNDGYVKVCGQFGHHRAKRGCEVYEHILVMEKHLGCKIEWPYHVHHINGDKADNRVENLQVVSSREHHEIHKSRRRLSRDKHGNQIIWTPKEDKVVSIEDAGQQDVYDIVMQDPYRNFVANGIVVHNCGKTAQAIVSAKRLGYLKILVVCPASLRLNWINELKKWWPKYSGSTLAVLNGKVDLEKLKQADFVTISYSLISNKKILPVLLSKDWDFLLFDEAHTALRNHDSVRGKICLEHLWNKAKKRIAITGTPMPNGRNIEVWPLFSKLAPDLFSDFKKYTDEYCYGVTTDWGIAYLGSKKQRELGQIARQRFMIRRGKEVLDQLPPLIRSTVELPLSPEVVGRYLKKHCPDFKHEMIEELVRQFEEGLPLSLKKDGPVSSARRELGLLKVEPSVEFVIDLIESLPSDGNPGVVVFAYHKNVIAELKDHFSKKKLSVVTVDGSTDPEDRQTAVDLFQNGKAQIFLGNIIAAGTGITLTRSSNIVIVEPEWVPSNNEQAESRCYRLTQKDLTRVFYLTVPESLDSAILGAVLRKQRDIKRTLG